MIQKLTILMHHANFASDIGHCIAIKTTRILPKQSNLPIGGDQFSVTQFQECCFSSARWTRQKVERARCKRQVQPREKLCSAIAISRIVQLDHASPPICGLGFGAKTQHMQSMLCAKRVQNLLRLPPRMVNIFERALLECSFDAKEQNYAADLPKLRCAV